MSRLNVLHGAFAFRRWILAAGLALAASPASAANYGYQLEQYEPTSPGTWFLSVDAPWYSATRDLSAGLTFDYGHDVLSGGVTNTQTGFAQELTVITHQVTGSLDIAGALFNRLQLSAKIPFDLYENGTPGFGVTPNGSVVVSDPRLSAAVRLWGEAEDDPLSLHVSGSLWIPVGTATQHAGDLVARGQLRAILAGLVVGHVRWAANLGVLLRAAEYINPNVETGPGQTGHELQAGAAIAYADPRHGFTVGPEATFGTVLAHAFQPGETTLEALLGAGYNIGHQVQVSAGVGTGFIASAGTPDLRAIVRVAYAPIKQEKPPVASLAQAQPPAPETVVAASEPASQTSDASASEPASPVGALGAQQPAPAASASAPATQALSAESAVGEAPSLKSTPSNGEPTPVVERGCRDDAAAAPGYPQLPTFSFPLSEATVSPADETRLAQLASQLSAHPEWRVLVTGHTDGSGPEDYNKDLSLRRAEAVRDYLVSHGVASRVFTTEGRAHHYPRCNEATPEGRASNRRVDLQIIGTKL